MYFVHAEALCDGEEDRYQEKPHRQDFDHRRQQDGDDGSNDQEDSGIPRYSQHELAQHRRNVLDCQQVRIHQR